MPGASPQSCSKEFEGGMARYELGQLLLSHIPSIKLLIASITVKKVYRYAIAGKKKKKKKSVIWTPLH